MTTVPDTRPHLVLVTLGTCDHSAVFQDLWNQFIEDPMVKLNFQVEHVACINTMDSISGIKSGMPAYCRSLVQWFPWLMLIQHDAWERLLPIPQDLDTKLKVCNGKFVSSHSNGGPGSIKYVNEYPPTYTGIKLWLRHCHDEHPSVYPLIEVKTPSYFCDIHDVALKFSLSPFWASAYRNRDLPFAPDSRKIIGSCYLDELKKRQIISGPSTHPNQFMEYCHQMKPILMELQLLGVTDYFNLDRPPAYYVPLIQRHLDLLINRHTI